MENIMEEGGVVKGRRDAYTTRAEVLREDPRHCITRPDVFRNPWIGVHPEAILRPGRVFFVVPNRTIHCLLRESENCKHPRRSPKQFSPLRAWAGMTPKKIPHQFQIRQPESDKNLRGKSIANQRDSHLEFEGNSSTINYSNPSKSKPKKTVNSNIVVADRLLSQNLVLENISVRKALSLRVIFDLPNKEDVE